jgi:hypothetical protein
MTEMISLDYDSVEDETSKAYLVRIEGDDYWLPKSQIGEMNADDYTIELPVWLAKEKGLY